MNITRRVTSPKRVTSPAWGPPPPCILLLRSHSQLKYHTPNYRRLMLRCQKGKSGEETTEKRQRMVLKRLVKQGKTMSFKKGSRILSENGRPEIFTKNRRFPAKMGALESLLISPRDCSRIDLCQPLMILLSLMHWCSLNN